MPMYSYRCSASSAVFDRFERMTETGKETKCNCGAIAKKVYHSPMAFVETECPIHRAPVTGEMITTNKQRREFMARNGLMDAGDFTPEYVIGKQNKRRAALKREADKLYADLPKGMTPEKIMNEVLND